MHWSCDLCWLVCNAEQLMEFSNRSKKRCKGSWPGVAGWIEVGLHRGKSGCGGERGRELGRAERGGAGARGGDGMSGCVWKLGVLRSGWNCEVDASMLQIRW
ncbi:MAG: hypothetical protein ACKESB_01350 [Candidatus Hodgkinia cicadicola]